MILETSIYTFTAAMETVGLASSTSAVECRSAGQGQSLQSSHRRQEIGAVKTETYFFLLLLLEVSKEGIVEGKPDAGLSKGLLQLLQFLGMLGSK